MNKLQLEEVKPDAGSSYRILNPKLSDTFLWHLHPEYEIVYAEAINGPRHVGSHVSRYQGSDLVFIGPNIPHLNFDYGVTTGCEQVVVQMPKNFMGETFFNSPEAKPIRQLFINAAYGLTFDGETKIRVAAMLKNLQQQAGFEQLLSLLQIFQLLANSTDVSILNDTPAANKAFEKQRTRMDVIYYYVEQHYNGKPDVNQIAEKVNLGVAAFCRFFKAQTGETFSDFVNRYRVNEAKNLLLQDKSVTETCYATGFEQLSYFNRVFKKLTGENPSAFKKRNLSAL